MKFVPRGQVIITGLDQRYIYVIFGLGSGLCYLFDAKHMKNNRLS